jgi:hypothetical protein
MNMESLRWNEITGKTIKSSDDEKMGKVKSLGSDFIEIEEGHISKKKCFIPKYYIKSYDGEDVYVDLPKNKILEKFERDEPPLPSELETEEYINRKKKIDSDYPQFVDGIPFMAKEPDIVLSIDTQKEELRIPWEEAVNKHVRSSDNVDIGDVEKVGNKFIVVREGVVKVRKYYIPTSYIDNYDGSNFYIKSPSGLISARFERITEPSVEELRLLTDEKPKEPPEL